MTNLVAVVLLGLLSMSVATAALQNVSAYDRHYSLTLNLDDGDSYLQGEKIKISGAISPIRGDDVAIVLELVDPSGRVYVSTEMTPQPVDDSQATYSQEIELGKDAPAGVWTLNARYASDYMIYDRENASFRVSESIDIIASPFLKTDMDGTIDSSAGEWASKYDSKYWKPFVHDPIDAEENIAFNAYYINGVLYGVFDVPDKTFDLIDFVEVGIDLENVGEDFKTGDNVYIFRVFRGGQYDSFRLGTEHLTGDRSDKPHFSAKVAEAGDMRMQVFDSSGGLIKVLNSLRDTSSTSYKGMLGIAGIEVDIRGNMYVLDSDSGTVSKFSPDGKLQGTFGSLGNDLKEFIDPTGIALDPDGNLYVADTGNARVQKFDNQGNFKGVFGSMGVDSIGIAGMAYESPSSQLRDDLFEGPEALAVDPSGNLYVLDRRTGSVSMFDGNGEFVTSFGSLVIPTGIAADPEGNVYVVEQGNNRVIKFDQDGNVLNSWGSFGIGDGMFKYPYGIAAGPDGHVYISDNINNRIQKFDNNGNFVAKWGTRGTGAGEFVSPAALAMDASNNLLHVMDAGNKRVQTFTSDGRFVGEFGALGSEQGNFMNPQSIAVDSSGNVYVSDLSSKKVQKFTSGGQFVLAVKFQDADGTSRTPFGVAVDASDNVYLSDPFNSVVGKFDQSGSLLMKWGGSEEVKPAPSLVDIPNVESYIAMDSESHAPIGIIDANVVEERGKGAYVIEGGQTWKILHIFQNTAYVRLVDYAKDAVLSWTPDGIDVDNYGNVYIVDRENEIAKKFDREGRLILKWGSSGSGDGEFSKPTAMALDSENSVYIVDTGNNRVQKFDSEGNFITAWGTQGQGPGEFDSPRGLETDGEDNVYVLDNGNSRVQKFDRKGNFITEWGEKGTAPGQFDNPSTEGIAIDSEGRVYVADLPGEAKATHWIAEVAIPLFLEQDAFGIYLAEGTYGAKLPSDPDRAGSLKVYDVYRNTWPVSAISPLPGTWARAELVNLDEVKIEPAVRIENMMVCEGETCAQLNDAGQVLAGTDLVVTASVGMEQAPAKFEYDKTELFLQFSSDGEEWFDVDSAVVIVGRNHHATANLRWIPLDSGDAMLRIVSSGVLTSEVSGEPVNLKILKSDAFQIRANLDWDGGRIVQGEPISFDLAFSGTDDAARMLESVDYDVRIIKDKEATLVPSAAFNGEGKKSANSSFRHTFTEAGSHLMQVRILGIGIDEDYMPSKKVFTYEINVIPMEPVQVSSIQRGEAMKIIIKNRDMSDLVLNSITLSLANIEKVDFRLPDGWNASVSTEEQSIEFSSNEAPLMPDSTLEFVLKSKALMDSTYDICWNVDQSSLTVNLC